jgi:hypothetical protein
MKAISKVLVRSLGVVLLVTAAQLDAAERMTSGQWEFTMTCGDRTIRSTSTYHGDRYEGVLKTKTATEETTTEVKARRLGACPK